MTARNTASALGEAIGLLIENEIEKLIKPICDMAGYFYDHGGARPGIRQRVKLSMVNKSGNSYNLDGVIENSKGDPIVIIESKYLRYKKHNRDKASWTCAAHYSLRKSHPTIRKSIAVLSGNWSLPSKKFMESFGIELYEITFKSITTVLSKYGVKFDWDEKDRETPDISWQIFSQLDQMDKDEIGRLLVSPIRNDLITSLQLTFASGEDWIKRVSELELLIKTDRNEYFTYSFASIKESIRFLLDLQTDIPDLSTHL